MILHIIFLIGVISTITGWLFDYAKHFKWFMLKIVPNYVFGQKALDDLEKDSKIALTKQHERFKILLGKITS